MQTLRTYRQSAPQLPNQAVNLTEYLLDSTPEECWLGLAGFDLMLWLASRPGVLTNSECLSFCNYCREKVSHLRDEDYQKEYDEREISEPSHYANLVTQCAEIAENMGSDSDRDIGLRAMMLVTAEFSVRVEPKLKYELICFLRERPVPRFEAVGQATAPVIP